MSGRGYGPRASLARSDDSDINLDCIGLRDALPVRERRNSTKRSQKLTLRKAPHCRHQTGPNQASATAVVAGLNSRAGPSPIPVWSTLNGHWLVAVVSNLFDMRTSITCLRRSDDADADHGVVAFASENSRGEIRCAHQTARPTGVHTRALAPRREITAWTSRCRRDRDRTSCTSCGRSRCPCRRR